MSERIGSGGMAEVFAAEMIGAAGFVRDVAIKRMRPEISRRPGFSRLFVREARLACLLDHPNIVSVLDFDRDDAGHHFLVMERILGVDLAGLWRTGPVPVAIGAFIVEQMLRGLAHAHELVHRGTPICIVHRDVSPQNVMLSLEGAVKLVDFGVARAFTEGHASLVDSLESVPGMRGKVGYMSPEQIHEVELDGRADVFATGVVLHELLTGRRLFAADSPAETVDRVLSAQVLPPGVLVPSLPDALSEVCMRMLVRSREGRFQSARSALEALNASRAQLPRVGSQDLMALLRERFAVSGMASTARGLRLSRDAIPRSPVSRAPARCVPESTGGGVHAFREVCTRTSSLVRDRRATRSSRGMRTRRARVRDARGATVWRSRGWRAPVSLVASLVALALTMTLGYLAW